MTTYATRISTAFGAGVDRVRRWSQGQEQLDRSPPRFATSVSDEDAISDSVTPPHSPTNPHTHLAPVSDTEEEDSASDQTLVSIEPSSTFRAIPTSTDTSDTVQSPPPPPSMPPPEGHLNAAAAATTSITTTSQRVTPIKGSALPEDDGQSQLRQKLSDITRSDLPERERAKKMHQIMTEKWNASRASKAALLADSPSAPTSSTLEATVDPDPSDKTNPYKLLPGDSDKTYYAGPGSNPDSEIEELGCSHYRRGVRLQCSTCQQWHTCRFCHDENEDHALVRTETKNMLCMHCGRPQPAQQDCRHCGVRSAKYYCDKVCARFFCWSCPWKPKTDYFALRIV